MDVENCFHVDSNTSSVHGGLHLIHDAKIEIPNKPISDQLKVQTDENYQNMENLKEEEEDIEERNKVEHHYSTRRRKSIYTYIRYS